MGRASQLVHNYPTLQNLVKRDAASYKEEFLRQYQHWEASLSIVRTAGAASLEGDQLEALITFLAHTAALYDESRSAYPAALIGLLREEAANLSSSLRRTLIQALLLLRKHNSVDLIELLELFFRLLRLPDKALRALLYESIVEEVRRANRPTRNNALNRLLQNHMYGLFASEERGEGTLTRHKILHIIIELYRKGVWNDARTVNVIGEAAIARDSSTKVMTAALNFFIGRFRGKALNGQSKDSDEESSADEAQDYQHMLHTSRYNAGKKRSTQKRLKKALNAMHRQEHKGDHGNGGKDQNGSFAAIHLLNDPQGWVEKLFGKLRKSNESFEVKLLMMNVISRVIGAHKVLLLDFYSFLNRYIQPHQRHVTHILAYAAQAVHNELSEDLVTPLVEAIQHNFVAEYCAAEVIAAGLNGIREICTRCPKAMTAELLQDLSGFKGYQDKGVVMASRSLIALYRELNPTLLSKRDRGKELSIAMKKGSLSVRLPGAIPHLDASGITAVVKEATERIDESKGQGEEQGKDQNDDDDRENDSSHDDSSQFESDGEESEDELDLEASGVDSAGEEVYESSTSETDGISVVEPKKSFKPKFMASKVDIVQLASQKFLTPAEVTLLRKRIHCQIENREEDEEGTNDDAVGNKEENDASDDDESGGDADEVVDPRRLESSKKKKATYTERMASIEAGRQGRLPFGSRKGKHHETGASLSNKLKEKRTKNAIMLAHKSSVRAKKRRSLQERQRTQLAHRRRQKRRR